MKKLFFVLSVMLFSVGAHAQRAVGTLTIQPKVGLNIANYTNSDGADSRIGLAMGAELESQITEKFSLSVGALYSRKGEFLLESIETEISRAGLVPEVERISRAECRR